MKPGFLMLLLILVQGACAIFFVSDILLNVLGVRSVPISWQAREMLELGAAIGLVLGVVLGWVVLRRTAERRREAEESLRVVQTAFHDVLEEKFSEWRLTPAERDVALFSLKGLSLQEIAGLRETSEGTVKAQSNAIYRKAGVSGRAQLLSLFIDDLLAEA
ncbi:helix-turn-helix transcriptional regulator [Shimia sediminis]|uniref:helix-turn-helix transcriptional regulator n=1 Tax=Shimia sediminis TaxID=2497945 RepID=UPI001F36DA58|nr:helix-turn-helix transcriptional regulator [Shimia sediminis]